MSRLVTSWRIRLVRGVLVRMPRRIAQGVRQVPLHFWEREDYRRMIAELPGPIGMAAEQAAMLKAQRLFREVYGGMVLNLAPLHAFTPENGFTYGRPPGAPLAKPRVITTDERGRITHVDDMSLDERMKRVRS